MRLFAYAPIISLLLSFGVSSCTKVSVPDARNVKIPSPVSAEERREAVNERPDSVMYLPLGADVLVPEKISGEAMPSDVVGPFELRSETLAGALQLILADYDVSIAFETEEGLSRKVTVANLRGKLNRVVERVCGLADLYCLYEDETLVVKDKQTFAVTLPPLAGAEGGGQFINDVIVGLSAILGGEGTPVSDPTTRSVIYTATQRTSRIAENYFQRLRANTAMIVFETYIWEVSLDSGNSTGIDWDQIDAFGKFNASIDLNGSIAADFTNPVSIGLPTTQALGASPTQLVEFLSQFGAVKTISQPQITVLSGSEAELRVADTENYVSEVTSTISGDNTTTSVSTDSVDSGFTLTIDSSWDKSTVYANVNINLTNVDQIEDFTFSDSGTGGTDTIIQLPQTTERELTTQIRMRPGDSVLIGGLVRETDNFNSRGPGFMEPVLPDSRTATTENLELVILLRPRVIVYSAQDDARYQNFVKEKRANVASQNLAIEKKDASENFMLEVLPRREAVQQLQQDAVEDADIQDVIEPKEDFMLEVLPRREAMPQLQQGVVEDTDIQDVIEPKLSQIEQSALQTELEKEAVVAKPTPLSPVQSAVNPPPHIPVREPYISRAPSYFLPVSRNVLEDSTFMIRKSLEIPSADVSKSLESVVEEVQAAPNIDNPTESRLIYREVLKNQSSNLPVVEVLEELNTPPSKTTTIPWDSPVNTPVY